MQNEPGACPLEYEGMHFTAETERDYVKTYLGPTLKKDHPDLNILLYDAQQMTMWLNMGPDCVLCTSDAVPLYL